MAIVEKEIIVKITNLTIDRYKNLGYKCKIGERIAISPTHAPKNDDILLHIECDSCKNIKQVKASSPIIQRDKGVYICQKCKDETTICDCCGGNCAHTYKDTGYTLCKKCITRYRKNNGHLQTRTKKSPNEIRIFEDYAEFDTYDKNYNVNGTFKIDLDMVDFVKEHKMHNHWGYACYKDKDKKNINLHKTILNVPETSVVDHINRDRSDNRRSNLREVSVLENNLNTGIFVTNTSGVKGVSQTKNGYYESYIHKNNHKVCLGQYKTIEEATLARKIGEFLVFGNKSLYFEELKKELKDIDIKNTYAYTKILNNKYIKQEELTQW